MDDERFKWGRILSACMRELRDAADELPVPFVDWEVIPNFDEGPEGMFAWFICASEKDKIKFMAKALNAATEALCRRMVRAGFSDTAVATLRTNVTSLEAIEAAGGRFAYFR